MGSRSCGLLVVHYLVTRDIGLIFAQPAAVYGLALLMAAFSTVLPIVLTSEGIRRIGASHSSIVASIGPIVTIFLGVLFLGEEITVLQLAGAGLVMAGILAISVQRKGQ